MVAFGGLSMVGPVDQKGQLSHWVQSSEWAQRIVSVA